MWVVMSIPSNDGETAEWFVFNTRTRKGKMCRSMKHAAETCTKLRRAEREKAASKKLRGGVTFIIGSGV